MIQGNGESVIKRNGVVAAPAFCALPILRSRFSKLTRFSGVLCGLCRCSHVAAEALITLDNSPRSAVWLHRAPRCKNAENSVLHFNSISYGINSKREFVMRRFVKKRDSIPSLPFVSPERAFVIE